jgi:hypothetical protein
MRHATKRDFFVPTAFALGLALLATVPAVAGQNGNGVMVGEPKIYEERTLRVMLQAAEQRLATLGPIDPSVVARVGSIQGGRESFSDLSLSATSLPTPQTQTQVTENVSATPSTATTTTTTQGAVTPQAPGNTTFPTGFGPSLGLQPTFGLSARDMLAEQLSLTFQIANLRLALERAASDRHFNGTTAGGRTFSFPRQPILLGFQVSVDSLSRYRGAVAEVRISLEDPDGKMISLLTLLPTRDTYNVAAITRKSTSLGAGAIVNVFQVGVGFRRGRGTYYLVQDSDVLGLEYPGTTPQQLTFGWQFRPVLGRKSVDAGLRQVYALVTLPQSQNSNDDRPIIGTVETRWRRWNANRQGLGDEIPGSLETQPFFLSPAMFRNLGRDLAPSVAGVDWVDLGADRALVMVDGQNFYSDTQVAVGDILLDRSNGLQIPEEGRLLFTTSLKALAASRDASLLGRYGRVPLETPGAGAEQASVKVESLDFLNPETVRIRLSAEGFGKLEKPIVVIGDTVFGGRDRPLRIRRKPKGTISGFELEAPISLIRTAQRFVVRDLFGGDDLFAEFRPVLTDDFTATKVVTLAKRKQGPLLGVVGTNFDQRMAVEVGGQEIGVRVVGDPPASLLTFEPANDLIAGVDQVVIRRKGTPIPPVLLTLNPKPEVKKPKLPESTQVSQGFSQPKKFIGTDLDSITKVVFEKEELKFEVVDKGAALEVVLTTHVTGTAGPKALEVHLVDGAVLFLPLEVTKS